LANKACSDILFLKKLPFLLYVYLSFFYTKQFMKFQTTEQKPMIILDSKLFFPLYVYTMPKTD